MFKLGFQTNHTLELLAVIVIFFLYQLSMNVSYVGLQQIFLVFGVTRSFSLRADYLVTINISTIYFTTKLLTLFATWRRIKVIRQIGIKSNTRGESAKKLQELSESFVKIRCVIVAINKCFGFNFLVRLFEFQFHCVFLLFSLYDILTYEITPTAAVFSVAGSFYFITEILFILPAIILSIAIKNEGTKLVTDFHQLQISLKHENSKFQQFELPDFETSVSCGLFKIDSKLVLSIISTILSYTIILIQFDKTDAFNKK
jgi:hypothetical protein